MNDGTILGIDLGERRIGIAIAESGLSFAVPKTTLKSWEEVFELIHELEVTQVVIGWPLELNGREGRATKKVEAFLVKLRLSFEDAEIEIVKWDERLSSVGGVNLLREAGLDAKAQRHVLDQVAATQILQSYLDSQHT